MQVNKLRKSDVENFRILYEKTFGINLDRTVAKGKLNDLIRIVQLSYPSQINEYENGNQNVTSRNSTAK